MGNVYLKRFPDAIFSERIDRSRFKGSGCLFAAYFELPRNDTSGDVP